MPFFFFFFLKQHTHCVCSQLIVWVNVFVVSVEKVLTIVYQAQAVFRIRPVSRCSATIAGMIFLYSWYQNVCMSFDLCKLEICSICEFIWFFIISFLIKKKKEERKKKKGEERNIDQLGGSCHLSLFCLRLDISNFVNFLKWENIWYIMKLLMSPLYVRLAFSCSYSCIKLVLYVPKLSLLKQEKKNR